MAIEQASPPSPASQPSVFQPGKPTSAPVDWAFVPELGVDATHPVARFTMRLAVAGPSTPAEYQFMVNGHAHGGVHQLGNGDEVTDAVVFSPPYQAQQVRVRWRQLGGAGGIDAGGTVVLQLVDISWGAGGK